MKMKLLALAIIALGITAANAQDNSKTTPKTTQHHHWVKSSAKTNKADSTQKANVKHHNSKDVKQKTSATKPPKK